MKSTSRLVAKLAGFFLLIPTSLFAFPSAEKAALSIVSSQANSLIMNGDRFLIEAAGNSISIIDTQIFALSAQQIPPLIDNSATSGGVNLTGDVTGLAVFSSSLIAAQSDGDFLSINLNDVTAQPTSTHVIDGALGDVAANPNGSLQDKNLYFVDQAHNAVIVFDTQAQKSTSIALVNGVGAAVTPDALIYAATPIGSSRPNKIYVTTEAGLVYVMQAGSTATPSTITLSTTNKSLLDAALTPNGDFLMVINATDTTVHVIDTATDTEVDTDPVASGTNPIALTQNAGLKGIVVANVTNPTDIYAFVTGSSGLSAIDLNIGVGPVFNPPSVIDFNNTGSGDTTPDPLRLSSSPGAVVASSTADGYLYTSDSNATISVITDKPFVSNLSTSLGTNSLTVNGSFTVTFRSDATGTYRAAVGGDQTGNGATVASGTVGTAGTDVTTASIPYDASKFAEGTNRIFVFVTDSSGLVGRNAIDINVDTPPPAIEIQSVNFGNEKIVVTFTRLTQNDIDHYNVYLTTDASTVVTATQATGTIPQPSSGNTVDAKIEGLLNGVTYFVGIEGVDKAGNIGPRTTTLKDGSPAEATPEETVGLAGAAGERGCGLVPEASGSSGCWLGIVMVGAMLIIARVLRSRAVLFLLIFLPSTLQAVEKTPQWFSLEFKGGVWMPLNRTTRDFLGTINPMGLAEFGFLYHSRYGAEIGVGYVGAGGSAVGKVSGAQSGDRFHFTMIPLCSSFTFRGVWKEDQLLIPYAKAGPDFWLFRENVQGNVTKGVKYGLHAALGLQVDLSYVEDLSEFMEETMGVNHIYFILEGRYGWINSFGRNGIDLSNLTASGGLLFEF